MISVVTCADKFVSEEGEGEGERGTYLHQDVYTLTRVVVTFTQDRFKDSQKSFERERLSSDQLGPQRHLSQGSAHILKAPERERLTLVATPGFGALFFLPLTPFFAIPSSTLTKILTSDLTGLNPA